MLVDWNHVLYRDRYVLFIAFPIMSLLITLIGTNHEFPALFAKAIIYKKIAYNYFTIVVLWLIVKCLINYFDNRWPWTTHFYKRWITQVTLSVLVCSIAIYLLTSFRDVIIPEWVFVPKTFFLTDMLMALVYIIGINFLYFHWWQVNNNKQELSMSQSEETTLKSPLLIKALEGKKTLLLKPDEIAYAFRDGDYYFVRTVDGKNLLAAHNLKSLELELDPKYFFRLNRKLLVHRNSIKSIKTLPSRQVEVELIPQFDGALLNKNKVAAFKKWLKP